MSGERGLIRAGGGMDRFTIDWLLRAADSPEKARREWTEQGVALLRCGRSFAAVRLPAVLVHAALVSDGVGELEFRLGGPVIHDGGPKFFALIQWHAGLVWDGEDDTPCLGAESYLGVPRLDLVTPPGPHWVVPPRDDERLCRPETVRRFIASARRNLAAAAGDAL